MAKDVSKPQVEVTWLDANLHVKDLELHETDCVTLAERRTMGYLIEERTADPSGFDKLVVAGTHDPPTGYSDFHAIPCGWIKEIKFFGRPRKRSHKATSVHKGEGKTPEKDGGVAHQPAEDGPDKGAADS